MNGLAVSLEDGTTLSDAAAAAASRSSPVVGLPAGVGLGLPAGFGLKSGRLWTASQDELLEPVRRRGVSVLCM